MKHLTTLTLFAVSACTCGPTHLHDLDDPFVDAGHPLDDAGAVGGGGEGGGLNEGGGGGDVDAGGGTGGGGVVVVMMPSVDAGARAYPPAVELSVGLQDACLRGIDNTVWCWGGNTQGQVGNGTTNPGHPMVGVTRVASLPGPAAQISAALNSCARLADGTAWCWGPNSFGSLGDGSASTMATSPVQLTALGADVVDLSAAKGSGCALKSDHSIWCWGYNTGGTLGFGPDTIAHPFPVQVATATSDYAGVSAGNNVVCAKKLDDSLYCWGTNDDAQVGNGTVSQYPDVVMTPSPLATLGSVLQVSVGASDTSCAIKSDHTLWCWGANNHGQLGVGTLDHDPHPTPEQVTALGSDVAQVSVAGYDVCAVKTDGTMWCWGWSSGRLCIGSSDYEVYSPMQVTQIGNQAVAAGAGEWMTCVLDKVGSVYCCDNGTLARPPDAVAAAPDAGP